MFEPVSNECDIVEFEDERMNHYLHHFDEYEMEDIEYTLIYNYMDVGTDMMEEIIWE